MQHTITFLRIIILLFLVLLVISCVQGKASTQFLNCLQEKRVIVFGSSGCPLTAEQKEIFGGSWENVPYVECLLPDGQISGVCAQSGVPSFPSWAFSGEEGHRGVLTLEELEKRTGCKLKP